MALGHIICWRFFVRPFRSGATESYNSSGHHNNKKQPMNVARYMDKVISRTNGIHFHLTHALTHSHTHSAKKSTKELIFFLLFDLICWAFIATIKKNRTGNSIRLNCIRQWVIQLQFGTKYVRLFRRLLLCVNALFVLLHFSAFS